MTSPQSKTAPSMTRGGSEFRLPRPAQQAVVGTVEHRGGGDRSKSQDQAHARQIAHASQPAMWSEDAEREVVPISSDAERPVPDARRTIDGRSEG
jgi:hypothetical protein